MSKKQKEILMYMIPFVLLLTMMGVFYFLSKSLGQKGGYFMSFLFYWLFWCLAVPLAIVGPKAIIEMLRPGSPIIGTKRIQNCILLLAPLVLVYVYEFPRVVGVANLPIVISSGALAIVNATAEEILWRGTFLKVMEASRAYIWISSFGFAIWHIAPQIVFSNKQPGGILSFVLVAFILGVFYSIVARDTKSILLVIIAHVLFDFSGLGGRLYFS